MDQAEKKRSWWDRNWKWALPIGCLASFILFAGFFVSIAFFVFGTIKSSDVYQQALTRAKANPEVTQALGTPIKEGMFVSGNISINGPSGAAALAIPIAGPDGAGTIFLEARKAAGLWTFSTLVVEIEKPNKRIDLLKVGATGLDVETGAEDASQK